jgi:UDP-glucose 4-epimerase
MKILITGGAGYIGSTIASALEDAGHTPIILDTLVRGREEFTRGRIFYQNDIADRAELEKILREHPDVYGTIHCAAFAVVPESTENPYLYYHENVGKSIELFNNLRELGQRRVVFSSSASIYADVDSFEVREDSPLDPRSPYARTKFMMEMVLRDFCAAYNLFGIALRYFNPIGADPQMRSGYHAKEATHVIGRLVDVALGKLPYFPMTGTDYTTRDGTGIRDYVHVWDLARAHVMAMEDFDGIFKRAGSPSTHYLVINLGTGHGVTVRELVTAFQKVYGKEVMVREMPRRPGDVPGAYANADVALKLIGWKPELSIEQGIADSLKWGEVRTGIIDFSK